MAAWGYSCGGKASSWLVELAPSFAPELYIAGGARRRRWPAGGRSLFGRRSGRQYSPSIVGVGTRCGARGVGCGTCGSGSSVDAGRVVGRV
ncbi:lipase family protein [Nocardia cyriacigeorgica]|uniref:lipase family protein n=1 Tax=Nocardia cyriacigeorgica TaxID=135487 RepID=UPI003CC80E21